MTDMFVSPAASWPAGHRAGLCVLTLLDDPTPTTESSESIGVDYGPTGLNRLLNLLADADLTTTVGFSPAALDVAPTLARQAAESGFDVVGRHDGNSDAEALTAVLTRIRGGAPNGQILGLPAKPFSGNAPGSAWAVTGNGGDLPQPIGEGWLIPTSPYWVDSAWLDPSRPLPPSSLLEAWSLSLAAVRSNGGLMTIVLHSHISGRPGFASQILRFLDEVIESGDVWIGNASQVAAWWAQQTT